MKMSEKDLIHRARDRWEDILLDEKYGIRTCQWVDLVEVAVCDTAEQLGSSTE